MQPNDIPISLQHKGMSDISTMNEERDFNLYYSQSPGEAGFVATSLWAESRGAYGFNRIF